MILSPKQRIILSPVDTLSSGKKEKTRKEFPFFCIKLYFMVCHKLKLTPNFKSVAEATFLKFYAFISYIIE